MAYTSVVVGTDGSATAEMAVRHAGRLAAADGARLIVVTAYTPQGDLLLAQETGVPDELKWALTDRVQAEERAQHGRQLANEEGASGVVAQAIAGSPADVLLETASDFAADLIVVGSKGLTSMKGRMIGSVASSVMHHAPCDVLVVQTT